MIDDSRRVSETLGTGQRVDAPFGGTVKDVHASCRAEIERLRKLTGRLAGLLTMFSLLMTKDEQEMVLEAMRGE